MDAFRNYDAWKTTAPEDREEEHPEDCRCRECDPDYHADMLADRREDEEVA